MYVRDNLVLMLSPDEKVKRKKKRKRMKKRKKQRRGTAITKSTRKTQIRGAHCGKVKQKASPIGSIN